ncbi:MAG: OsmC family peroxiredoxin [Microbacteriaceae bacterium]|nr:MAG: OsmC family peroxiredoxin [Microbacteriaceae bacterium]
MNLEHHYAVATLWTGNRGTGTSGYREYGRDHVLRADGKPDIVGSSDRVFFGDADRWNPEELLLAALSQCHMLSYLHVAVRHGVRVLAYSDAATGTLQQDASDGGRFTIAVLHPRVTIADPAQLELAQSLHAEAAQKCFIAASVNFPVTHEPETHPAV